MRRAPTRKSGEGGGAETPNFTAKEESEISCKSSIEEVEVEVRRRSGISVGHSASRLRWPGGCAMPSHDAGNCCAGKHTRRLVQLETRLPPPSVSLLLLSSPHRPRLSPSRSFLTLFSSPSCSFPSSLAPLPFPPFLFLSRVLSLFLSSSRLLLPSFPTSLPF